MCHYHTYPVIICLRHILHVEVGSLRIVKVESELRTGIHEDVQASLFPTPSQVSENRYLDIIDGTAVSHRLLGFGDDDRLVVDVENILFPSHLGIVDLCIDGTDGLEVLLASIFHRESGSHSSMLLLLNLRFESYRAEHIATVESDGKIVAMLTYLSLCRESSPKEKSHQQRPYLDFIHSFFSYYKRLTIKNYRS